MSFDKVISTYIFDGEPNGQMMCELSNWNGRVYKIARSYLTKFFVRPDSENTGVYFLFGKGDDNIDSVYIGEAEKISQRLKQHLNEDYWNECIVVISKDNNLNKAHIKYLENRFYNLAKLSERFEVKNGNEPTKSSVSEFDEGMLEEFIFNAKLLVNVLGYRVFEVIKEPLEVSKTFNENVEFYFTNKNHGYEAKGIQVVDGFAVLKGTKVSNDTVPSMSHHLCKKREILFAQGIIDGNNTFTKNYVFGSPSTAAAIVSGRSINGRIEWKTKEGKTLKEIETERASLSINKKK